jgi:hypothetical protein
VLYGKEMNGFTRGERRGMSKKNCWEWKRCGREPDGDRIGELGPCPAAIETIADGINGGTNGGRACWALAGTLCGGEVQGTFASKLGGCIKCDFFKLVAREEGESLKNVKEIHRQIY